MDKTEDRIKPVLSIHNIPAGDYQRDPGEDVCLWWLGQAGFLIRHKSLTLLVDPYLSDFLAGKYAGGKYPHHRMMPPPLPMESLTGVDFCLSTHAHSDHLDPGFMPVLVKNSPGCRFILPRAEVETGKERGIPQNRMIPLNAGEAVEPALGFRVEAIPSAHETISTDAWGNHRFLGYFLTLGDLQIYHPGDCVPYPELDSWFGTRRPHLALLPVNGRREELSREGIAGNFSFAQACELMDSQKINFMIAHHYGMFDFNTVDPLILEEEIARQEREKQVYPAKTGILYRLGRSSHVG